LMSEFNGNALSSLDRVRNLKYWMEERERIRLKKESGQPKPWSDDPIFQTTYFCNVNRENDRVTKGIRALYSGYVGDELFEVNIGFARIINRIETLKQIGYIRSAASFPNVGYALSELKKEGNTVFGDAYIVSTNGRAMPKAQYVAEVLLPALYEGVGPGFHSPQYLAAPTLAAWYEHYMAVFGISSFMAGQNLADLKHTVDHPLASARDKTTWSCPGPGSLRGLSWIEYGTADKPSSRTYVRDIASVAVLLRLERCEIQYDMQDLQNCLCEFDKYMRINNGTGRSKRRYPGC
jgi:hypothetical protein